MTRLQLRTLVWSLLDDPLGGYFTEAQVNVWLNNAQKEVQKTLNQAFEGHSIKKVLTTLVVGQREYALPSDFKRLHRLELLISGTIPSNEQVQRLGKITIVFNGQGTPCNYYFRGNYVVVVPAPDTALLLRMEYEYLVADMSADGDSPDLPEQYQEMVALYAARKGFLKDGRDASLINLEIKDFETGLKRDAEDRNADEPRTVVQTLFDDESYGDMY